jgi:Ni,Fe-hydrogenase III large subunit
MTLLGARHQKRPSALKKLVSRVMARNLSCLIVPGPEVALAHGLDVTAAGMRIAATPRDAGVLLIIGELSQKMDEVVAVLYAQMPRPRATLVLGGPAPSSLPHPDVSAGLSQEELTEAVGRVQRAMAEGAFAASPEDFDASVLHVRIEYVCPMHPEVVQDEPGSCPKCGMDLVAHEAGEDEGATEEASGHHGHDHEHHHDHEQQHDGSDGHSEDEHSGHEHDHGASGFMSMIEVTKDLSRSADGLQMDWLEVPFGPVFPGLPGGLKLTFTLDGDGVTGGQATSLAGMTTEGEDFEEVDAGTFIDHLASAMPLAPVSYRLLACLAIEQAAGLNDDPATTQARNAALERERIASHLGWLAQVGRQLGFAWLTHRASTLQLQFRDANRNRFVELEPALRALGTRLGRTPLLKARLKGIGVLSTESSDLRGPVARAANEGGDAWARLWQRLAEISASFDLIKGAGEPELPSLRDIGGVSGTGEATVDTPRGEANLRLKLARGHVKSYKLDTACSHHIGLVEKLVEGRELGDALVAVGSLDLSPWEVIP